MMILFFEMALILVLHEAGADTVNSISSDSSFLLFISFIDGFHIINLLPGTRSASRNSNTCSSRD